MTALALPYPSYPIPAICETNFFFISVWREMQQSPLVVAFAAGKAKWRPVEFGHQIWSHLFCLGIIVPCCRFLVRQQRNSQAWQVGS